MTVLKNLTLMAALSWSTSFSTPSRSTKTDHPQLVIAIIDTGVDFNHKKLKGYLWSNPGETGLDSQGRDKSSNGIDDDANGFIDDVHGWDFVSNSPRIFDRHGHGTHIAGIIADGITKSAPVKFMVLKYYEDLKSEEQTLHASNRAFEYAIKMGARIINYSGGGDTPHKDEKKWVKKALDKEILIVAASGNEGRSNDTIGFYPASYGYENIISVASADSYGRILSSSNYGRQTVDILAPGKEILSALPYGQIGKMTGTSQATAVVTGILASVLSQFPHLKLHESKERLFNTARSYPDLYDKLKVPGIPDAKRALSMRDESDFNEMLSITSKRVSEVFDDPLTLPTERTLSSDLGPTLTVQE